MKTAIYVSGALWLLTAGASAADELCYAVTDTALFADAALTEEVRPVFQFDGAQFVPSAKEGDTMFGMAYDVRMQPMLEESSYVRASDWTCEVLAGASNDGAASASAEQMYDVSQEACQQDLSDTRITLSESNISFYESGCDILSEEAGNDGARLLSLQCYGEGEEWTVAAAITPRSDGAIELKVDEFVETYVPCG